MLAAAAAAVGVLRCAAPAGATEGEPARVDDALRAELRALSLLQVRKRAELAGIAPAVLEGTLESANPKDATIDLILEKEPTVVSSSDLRTDDLQGQGADKRAPAERNALAHVDGRDEQHAADEDSEEVVALTCELRGVRLMALQKRAVSEGVSTEALEDAMDADDPKGEVIAAIVQIALSRGPADQLLSAVQAGGETAADAVSSVLDHAMDVLEQLSVSSPRKSRKSVRKSLESVEELAERMDSAWCDGVSRCSPDRLGPRCRHGSNSWRACSWDP